MVQDLVQKLHIDRLCTITCQENEQDFLFGGQSCSHWSLVYILQGSLHASIQGRDLLLKQGELVLHAPGQWYMQYADPGVTPRFLEIGFTASGVDLSCLQDRYFSGSAAVSSLLEHMLQELAAPDAVAEDMLIFLLSQLLLLLQREGGIPLPPAGSENQIILRAQKFISEQVRQKLSVPLVAKNIDVSPSYMTALFQKHLQIAPGEYIRRVKLQESKLMIRENQLSFTQIAEVLQYSTIHHFSRQFKEKFGITPSEYAKKVR